MIVALTGATGFVGRQILRALLEQDVAVRIIKRPESSLTAQATPMIVWKFT